MRILHYFLGFPPYRSGGLTAFCLNLMNSQVNAKNTVIGLWPGQIKSFHHQPFFRKKKNYCSIQNYELVNPLPVPLDEGITSIQEFMKSCDMQIYYDFLKQTRPEIIHVQRLWEYIRSFFEAACKCNIKTIFTTHDYFGICPCVTLFRHGQNCTDDHNCRDCEKCNLHALSLRKIQLLQSPIYRILKNTTLFKLLRSKHRKSFYQIADKKEIDDKIEGVEVLNIHNVGYDRLRCFYLEMLENIDLIHFNSSVSESVYRRYISPKSSCLITISNNEIEDNRLVPSIPSSKIRLTYLSPIRENKGYYIIIKALDDLWNQGRKDFELRFFGNAPKVSSYMVCMGDGYKRSELREIMQNTDILLAPSVWYETFGFTVLEALSYGVPVIVSDTVGAKDIIRGGGIKVVSGSIESFKSAISSLTKEKIKEMKMLIQNEVEIKTWQQFMKEYEMMLRQLID